MNLTATKTDGSPIPAPSNEGKESAGNVSSILNKSISDTRPESGGSSGQGATGELRARHPHFTVVDGCPVHPCQETAGQALSSGGDKSCPYPDSGGSEEIVCPECGGQLVYGSHDPCEGFAFWCDRCGFGPVWVDNPRVVLKPAGRVIDADIARAAAGVQGRAAAIQGTVFADRAPFDPAGFIEDVIGS